jgi:hypothetical protein
MNLTRFAAVFCLLTLLVGASVQAGPVLDRQGKYELNRDQVLVGVGIVEFIIGQKIKASEVDELIVASKREFKLDPASFVYQVRQLEQSLTKLRSLTDALLIGRARQELLAAFHAATMALPAEKIPLLIRLVKRYVKVLKYDQRHNLALTDRDLEGALQYMRFSHELAGQPFQITEAVRQEFSKSTLAAFPKMRLAQKRFFCSASLAWSLVDANWKKLSPAQRQQLKTAYTQRAGATRAKASTRAPASSVKFPKGWDKMDKAQKQALIRKRMRSNTARQNMYSMMQNSALQNHATMLNTIENFGGTGRYWEVVTP